MEPIVVEQTFDLAPFSVWKAITDKDQMQQWYFEPITQFEPEVGFETQFNVHVDGQDYLHLWKVIDVEIPTRIAYQWRYDGVPGNSCVRWELFEEPEGTRLKLTHEVIEPFPQDNPIFSRESGEAGWDYFINQSLKDFLER